MEKTFGKKSFFKKKHDLLEYRIQNTFLEKYKVPKYQLTQVIQASWSQMKHSWRNTFKNSQSKYIFTAGSVKVKPLFLALMLF